MYIILDTEMEQGELSCNFSYALSERNVEWARCQRGGIGGVLDTITSLMAKLPYFLDIKFRNSYKDVEVNVKNGTFCLKFPEPKHSAAGEKLIIKEVKLFFFGYGGLLVKVFSKNHLSRHSFIAPQIRKSSTKTEYHLNIPISTSLESFTFLFADQYNTNEKRILTDSKMGVFAQRVVSEVLDHPHVHAVEVARNTIILYHSPVPHDDREIDARFFETMKNLITEASMNSPCIFIKPTPFPEESEVKQHTNGGDMPVADAVKHFLKSFQNLFRR